MLGVECPPAPSFQEPQLAVVEATVKGVEPAGGGAIALAGLSVVGIRSFTVASCTSTDEESTVDVDGGALVEKPEFIDCVSLGQV